MVAKVQRPDCQISQLGWHVVPCCGNYLNCSRNVNIHLSEPCTLEFCTMGKMCPGFLRKECWSVKTSRLIMGFFFFNKQYTLKRRKKKREKREKNGKKINQTKVVGSNCSKCNLL